MRRSLLAGSFCAGLLLIVTPLPAQNVSAEVAVRSGPVTGRVIVNDPHPRHEYRRVIVDRRVAVRRVVIERDWPRAIVVERFRQARGRHWKPWKHGYRVVTVYYVRGRYYDRFDRRYPGLIEVVVYERDGHFYRDGD